MLWLFYIPVISPNPSPILKINFRLYSVSIPFPNVNNKWVLEGLIYTNYGTGCKSVKNVCNYIWTDIEVFIRLNSAVQDMHIWWSKFQILNEPWLIFHKNGSYNLENKSKLYHKIISRNILSLSLNN